LLIGGVAGSIIVLVYHCSAIWLVATTISTVSGSRYIVATIIHHGVHNAVFKTESLNRILCEILSTVTAAQPFDSYRRFHVYEHHGRDFSTMGDQDLAAIYTLGLRPGISVTHMKVILAWHCVNPVFHARYLFGRVKSNLVSVPLYRLTMTIAWFALLALSAFELGWVTFVISIALPLTVFYQICSLLHLVTEHAWVLRTEGGSVRASHINNSHARFCGRATPSTSLHGIRLAAAWTIWVAEHLLVHLPVRMLIVQGSLIVHDWHHRAGADRGWPNAIQKREADLQRELATGSCSYHDLWGIQNIITEVLERISDAPPLKP
jgi:hypothetical protein